MLPADTVARVPDAWIDRFAGRMATLAQAAGAPTDPPFGPGPVAVAVSGGPDSLLAAVLAAAWARRAERDCRALIVDHRLRPGSGEEARRVAGALNAAGIPSDILVWTAPRPGHAAARDARYRLLGQAAHRLAAAVLITGHHADDQRETVALRLSRGSAFAGLAGMPAVRRLTDRLTLCRPFLADRRSDLAAAGARLGLRPVSDPSNGARQYARARVRVMLAQPEAVGLGAEMGPSLDRVAAAAAGWRAAREREAVRLLTEAVRFPWWGGAVVDPTPFRLADPKAAGIALTRLVEAIGGRRGKAGADPTAALQPGARAMSLAGCTLFPHGQALWIAAELGRLPRRPSIERVGDRTLVAGRFWVCGGDNPVDPDQWTWLGTGRRPAAWRGRIADRAAAALPVFRGTCHPSPATDRTGLGPGADQQCLMEFAPAVFSRVDRGAFPVVLAGPTITL